MSNKLNSKKHAMLIVTFLSLFILGTVLIFNVPLVVKITYGQSVKTENGETISFNVFEPQSGGEKMKAVIIGHGVFVNKEYMKSIAIELAASGFVAITLDFEGHGMSSGILESWDPLLGDILAIKAYLKKRGDIDTDNLGYVGYSMGGIPAEKLLKNDNAFKFFVGIGTFITTDPDYVIKTNSGRFLNILLIVSKYDQAVDMNDLKKGMGMRLGMKMEEIKVNVLYGSFQSGTASKIYVDDNSEHTISPWDQDVVREARDWVINTFPNEESSDENFYANIRFLILAIQLIGGLGFFFLLVDPLTSKIIGIKEKSLIETDEMNKKPLKQVKTKAVLYSISIGFVGIIILSPIFLFLPLAITGFVNILFFAGAFALLFLIRQIGNRNNKSLLEMLKIPFRGTRNSIMRQLLLGIILGITFLLIFYLSVGLNYIGNVPSIYRLFWIPIYFSITFFCFFIYGLTFSEIIQARLDRNFGTLFWNTITIFGYIMTFMSIYILLVCLITGGLFFTVTLVVLAPLVLLNAFIMTFLYKKTGNILASTMIITFLFTFISMILTITLSGADFITLFVSHN